MIIALAADTDRLQSVIDRHFGRCGWFCLYDTDTHGCSFLKNNVRFDDEKAGCGAANLLIEKGVRVVVAGRFGIKAMKVLKDNSVQMIIPEKEQEISEFIASFR